MKNIVWILVFCLLGGVVSAQSYNKITGKQEFTDSIKFSKYNNSAGNDSVLTVDRITKKLIFLKNGTGSGGGSDTSFKVVADTFLRNAITPRKLNMYVFTSSDTTLWQLKDSSLGNNNWRPIGQYAQAGIGIRITPNGSTLRFDATSTSGSLPNGLISTGGILNVSGVVKIVPNIVYAINGRVWTLTDTSFFSIPSADPGFYRSDVIYADTIGVLHRIQGTQSSIIGVTMAIPDSTILVTTVNVFGSIITGTDPGGNGDRIISILKNDGRDSVITLFNDGRRIAVKDSIGSSQAVTDTSFTGVLDSLNTPPVSPVAGDVYEVGTSPTGVWVGHATQIATWSGSSWSYVTPTRGALLLNAANYLVSQFNGTIWVRVGKAVLHQGGDKFGAGGAVFGTNDAQPAYISTNGVKRFIVSSVGGFTMAGIGTGFVKAVSGVISTGAAVDTIFKTGTNINFTINGRSHSIKDSTGGSGNDSVYVNLDTTADGNNYTLRRLNGGIDTFGVRGGINSTTLSDSLSKYKLIADTVLNTGYRSVGQSNKTRDSLLTLIALRLRISDTASMLSPYKTSYPRQAISLTTTGSSGAATYDNSTGILNVPSYSGGGSSFWVQGASNNIYWLGKAGINTVAPTAKFEIRGNGLIGSPNDSTGIILGDSSVSVSGTNYSAPPLIFKSSNFTTGANQVNSHLYAGTNWSGATGLIYGINFNGAGYRDSLIISNNGWMGLLGGSPTSPITINNYTSTSNPVTSFGTQNTDNYVAIGGRGWVGYSATRAATILQAIGTTNRVNLNVSSTFDGAGSTLLTVVGRSVNGIGQVGIGTSTPDNSAAVDVTSLIRGFLIPRMTTTVRNNMKYISSITIGGSKTVNYTAGAVTVTDPTGSGSSISANVTAGSVVSFVYNQAGAGYSSPTITPASGSGQTFTAVLSPTAIKGEMIYDSTLNALVTWDGQQWLTHQAGISQQATLSGNGSATSFTIAHGLLGVTSASVAIAIAANAAAAGITYVTADATNITVFYSVAPASGTNNLLINWQLRP